MAFRGPFQPKLSYNSVILPSSKTLFEIKIYAGKGCKLEYSYVNILCILYLIKFYVPFTSNATKIMVNIF